MPHMRIGIITYEDVIKCNRDGAFSCGSCIKQDTGSFP